MQSFSTFRLRDKWIGREASTWTCSDGSDSIEHWIVHSWVAWIDSQHSSMRFIQASSMISATASSQCFVESLPSQDTKPLGPLSVILLIYYHCKRRYHSATAACEGAWSSRAPGVSSRRVPGVSSRRVSGLSFRRVSGDSLSDQKIMMWRSSLNSHGGYLRVMFLALSPWNCIAKCYNSRMILNHPKIAFNKCVLSQLPSVSR